MPMRLPGFTSLKSTVTLVVFVALLPALCLIVFSGYQAHRSAVLGAEATAVSIVRNIGREQRIAIESENTLMATLAQMNEIKKGDADACSVIFQNLLLFSPNYLDIRLYDRNGIPLASASLTPASTVGPPPPARKERLHVALETRKFTVLSFADTAGASALFCVYPVLEGETLTGLLALTVQIQLPADRLRTLTDSGISDLRILDADGRILFGAGFLFPFFRVYTGHCPRCTAIITRQSNE